MQLQKVVGIDPSMWPYRVHVRHALSSMQLQKIVGIEPSMWHRVHVRHALSSMQLQKVVGIDTTYVAVSSSCIIYVTKGSWHSPSMWPYIRHALSSIQLQKVVGIDPSMWLCGFIVR